MKTIAYVDGFNLYYGSVRGTPWKWLHLGRLLGGLLPGDQIVRIEYFTARVKPSPLDPLSDVRQQTYLRALRTIPGLTVHYGHFLSNPVRLPRIPLTVPPHIVEVLRTEEKGSDVNLTTQLLIDCFNDAYDQAVVVSADSDFVAPIEAVRAAPFNKRVGVLFPTRRHSVQLQRCADFTRRIRERAVKAFQFPDSMSDEQGVFSKPSSW